MCSMIWVNDILENERMKMLFKNYTEGHKWNYSFVFISMSSTGKCMWNTDFDLCSMSSLTHIKIITVFHKTFT
jgi:hypothetical protein